MTDKGKDSKDHTAAKARAVTETDEEKEAREAQEQAEKDAATNAQATQDLLDEQQRARDEENEHNDPEEVVNGVKVENSRCDICGLPVDPDALESETHTGQDGTETVVRGHGLCLANAQGG